MSNEERKFNFFVFFKRFWRSVCVSSHLQIATVNHFAFGRIERKVMEMTLVMGTTSCFGDDISKSVISSWQERKVCSHAINLKRYRAFVLQERNHISKTSICVHRMVDYPN